MSAVSRSVQDYLKAIHRLGGDRNQVTPNEIVELLNVRASSVTGMLKKLAKASLIEYEARQGAILTAEGLRLALQVIRRHRLIELLLTKVLGLDWSEVDVEAEALEHAISPRVEQAIAAHLGEPLEDPHGHLIPTVDGQMAKRELKRIVDCHSGDSLVIREVSDSHPDRLRRWQQLGLIPGAKIKVIEYHSLDDIFTIRVSAQKKSIHLGSDGLAGLLVEKAKS
ncbi:MAG: metal-dependent transcriptional regulator [Zavarzinella sp.]